MTYNKQKTFISFAIQHIFSSTLSQYLWKKLDYTHAHSDEIQWKMQFKWWQIIFICLIESTQCGPNKNGEKTFFNVDCSSPVNWKSNFRSVSKQNRSIVKRKVNWLKDCYVFTGQRVSLQQVQIQVQV